MECEIKKAGTEDCKLVFNLTKQAFQDYLGPAFSSLVPALQESIGDVAEEIKKKEVLIAYLDGKAAGSVRFSLLTESQYCLSRLGVLDEYQGQQVGKELIKAVEKRVIEKGGQEIILYSAYRKKELINFYQSLGYQIVKIRNDNDYMRAKLKKQLNYKSQKVEVIT
ncbi:putative acetyltransferase [Halobacteroides halobius DSM 5150]|uniref:Putative acetyltransferase n=1 Tax=Halobacteroides halobius (strain ATCC 35273 / DSM 5150 / MD-1) TaxID=748449 RepID=L0KB13_HALHC|nr:GNAT family N-acetyltransferase [Halobacteroides halobius]AGB41564.1 putative acetyltransferase [Halobacteroides halobius DSM 5150]